MKRTTRRRFLAQSAVAATATILHRTKIVRAERARPQVRVAVIGCGNQGGSHIRSLKSLPDAEIVYVCDVDSDRLSKAVTDSGGAQGVSDLRKILDDRSIEAVTIATPDHWHAPAALLALDAGKHVYVEKPCAHNVRESQLLLKKAREQNRVVQHGTQSRSSPGLKSAIQQLRDGIIGDVLTATCWNWQRRKSIGHAAPSSPPPGVDYDTWIGPAEMMPFQANRFHYDWHWWYNFGCGDAGNDGIHEIDMALWGLGVSTHPTTVSAVGGKYYFDDDQQFPDTQQMVLEFGSDQGVGARKMLIYEQRLWSTNYPHNVDAGVEFHGTKGRMFLSKRGKLEVLGERNEQLAAKTSDEFKADVAENQQNWLDCIRSGERPNADIEIGHRSATAIHLGNIATRLGRTLQFDPEKEQVQGDDEANKLLARTYRHEGHWSLPKGIV